MIKLIKYEENNDLIIFTKDIYYENYLNTQELPIKHCIKGTIGREIPAQILRNNKLIFEKETFGSKDLIEYLNAIDFSEIELIGLCTDVCVISNAILIKAYFKEKEIKVDSKCCAGVAVKLHSEALNTMAMCQIEVV